MKKIYFNISLNRKDYTGYLGTNDQRNPPKTFFVFVENYIIGELDLLGKNWNFRQGGRYKFIGQLTQGECNYLAEYLGNIAVLGWDSMGV